MVMKELESLGGGFWTASGLQPSFPKTEELGAKRFVCFSTRGVMFIPSFVIKCA